MIFSIYLGQQKSQICKLFETLLEQTLLEQTLLEQTLFDQKLLEQNFRVPLQLDFCLDRLDFHTTGSAVV
jgi:hypothetical protein